MAPSGGVSPTESVRKRARTANFQLLHQKHVDVNERISECSDIYIFIDKNDFQSGYIQSKMLWFLKGLYALFSKLYTHLRSCMKNQYGSFSSPNSDTFYNNDGIDHTDVVAICALHRASVGVIVLIRVFPRRRHL